MGEILRVEDLKKYFDMTVEYFNQVLHIPLKIYLADEEAVEYLHLKESEDFVVTEQVDLKDYLYDGEAMRKLSGKKLHKKKNLRRLSGTRRGFSRSTPHRSTPSSRR